MTEILAIPEGYVFASKARYSKIRKAHGVEYSHSVQLLNPNTGDMQRGIGTSYVAALRDVLSKIKKVNHD